MLNQQNGGFDKAFPIHWLVWHNDISKLHEELQGDSRADVEKRDPRGRTPLLLAVTLGHLECARVLLSHNADANAETHNYWGVSHEAITSGDPELVQLIIQHRDYQRYKRRLQVAADLLDKLKDTPDFYVEMRWEFTSWVPLVSRMCPSDTYKVYKRGSNVRIDTTLIGFDQTNWQRGNVSFMFQTNGANMAVLQEINHDRHTVYSETMALHPQQNNDLSDLDSFKPTSDAIAERLTSPVVTSFIDIEKIAFERAKSGIWGFRTDRAEDINGFGCKVYCASNADFVTKTRTEHLTEQDKAEAEKNKTHLDSFLKVLQGKETKEGEVSQDDERSYSTNPCQITPEEYFNPYIDLGTRDIGRPRDQRSRSQRFKATLWLCEDYPLSLPEQVTPIIDLMSASNAHFARLKNFIELQLPAGFPVKIEIPLFHVLNACITFGNIFATTNPVPHVETVLAPDGSMQCVIHEDVFEIPANYSVLESGGGLSTSDAVATRSGHHHQQRLNEEEMWLQFAIQQSLSPDSEGIPNNGQYFYVPPDTDFDLQRAINESLSMYNNQHSPSAAQANEQLRLHDAVVAGPLAEQPLPVLPSTTAPLIDDSVLAQALQASAREQELMLQQQREEEEQLAQVLALSLLDK